MMWRYYCFFAAVSLLTAQTTNTTLSSAQQAVQQVNLGSVVQVRLRYDGPYGNYLRFYDEQGIVVLLAFRRHPWDYTQNFMLRQLQRGHLYQVTFSYEGQKTNFPPANAPLEEALSLKEDNQVIAKPIRKPQTYILGRIFSYQAASLEDLRF